MNQQVLNAEHNQYQTHQRRNESTSGAKGQLSNALRIRAHSLISRFLISFLISTRSSGGRLGSVSGLRRDCAPGANDLIHRK